MTKRVTIIDLAEAADVSISTVDRILNKRGPVQRATAEHVLAVAQRIGFQGLPNLRRRLSEGAPERTFGFLLNRRERFLYDSFARALVDATTQSTKIRGKAIVRHLDDLSPDATAKALLALGQECDSIAGVCIDHPVVNEAIGELALRDIPFWAMLSDVSAPQRAGFVGTDCHKLGRSAGWFMSRICAPNATIAILIGSDLYLGHKEFEAGFRDYMGEATTGFTLLATRQTEEDDLRAHALTLDLLDREPDLQAIFMAGGGIDGVVRARQERSRSPLTIVSTEISEITHGHLESDLVDLALSHEFDRVARAIVRNMEARAAKSTSSVAVTENVPMKVAIKENF